MFCIFHSSKMLRGFITKFQNRAFHCFECFYLFSQKKKKWCGGNGAFGDAGKMELYNEKEGVFATDIRK